MWGFAVSNYPEESFRNEVRRNEDRTFDLNFSTGHFATSIAAQTANIIMQRLLFIE
jgi:hypothetical protein